MRYKNTLRFEKAIITDKICHIPEILYTWRESQNSTAANAESKPYANDAGKKALEEGYRPLIVDGIRKVLKGETTLDELNKKLLFF